MQNHHYGDISNLNAPYDTIVYPVQGVGQSPVPDAVTECGHYPWREFSNCTEILQNTAINPLLREDGFNEIGSDGKLGPVTCGAMAHYEASHWAPACAEHESEWVAPTRSGSSSSEEEEELVGVGRPSAGVPPWAIGLAIGAAAVGLSLYLKKKR